jgi:membrane fusion protein, multidrug efflux system
MEMDARMKAVIALIIFSIMFLIVGCASQVPPAPPPVPEVAAVTVRTERTVLASELPGRTSPYRVAEIRPQVSGIIQKRLFEEGAVVKAGDVLYRIDPAPFQAAYDNAAANLAVVRKGLDRAKAALQASIANVAKQQSTLDLARTNRQRAEQLYKKDFIPATQRDQAFSDAEVGEAGLRAAEAQVASDREAVGAAEAAIQQAEAGLETARINRAYTRVTAPISGRIGKSNVTDGALVAAYQPTALASIQQLDPIYVDVPQSTSELLRLRQTTEQGRLSTNGENQKRV